MKEKGPQREFAELKTKEQIESAMTEALKNAKDEKGAEHLLKKALEGQPFMFMGPMVNFSEITGSAQALLSLLQELPEVEQGTLKKKMMGLLQLPPKERDEAAKKILIDTPQDNSHGIPVIDFTKTISLRFSNCVN